MRKKVTMGTKPQGAKPPAGVDEWVSAGQASTGAAAPPTEVPQEPEAERMKRLTIDVPETLHRRIKRTCADRGVKMADEIRILLEQHFDDA